MNLGFTLGDAFPAVGTGMANLPDLFRFSAEDDDGKSLTRAAQRDFESALQLLAERAQHIMGASVAIALSEGNEMICRASAGPAAPAVDSVVLVDEGLAAESIRTEQTLRCDDAENDRRVDRASCRASGVKSLMVAPLLREQKVAGIFQLFAERSYAFEERDVAVVERLSQMALTALDHAEAAERAENEFVACAVEDAKESVPTKVVDIPSANALSPDLAQQFGEIHKCSACGFPVSATRSLCLDCEKAKSAANGTETSGDASGFLAGYASAEERNWRATGFYVAALLGGALGTVWLVFKLH